MVLLNLTHKNKKRFYWLIVILCFVVYFNGINNEYAIDDDQVIDGVEKVEKGISGIPEILTSHYMQTKDGKQSYAYRPIVLITFAIEKQFFGALPTSQTLKEKEKRDKLTQANISHFVNVLLYAFTCMLVFYFMTLLLDNENLLVPLITALIFVVHPLHTEPVNNIKSRDEVLMLLGVVSALIFFLKYAQKPSVKYLAVASLITCLTFLCKPTGVALIALTPLVLFFKKIKTKNILIASGSVLGIYLIFASLQLSLAHAEQRDFFYFENPLKFQGGIVDRLLMAGYCSWFYLKMLIFPKDLSFYYGYSQIPLASLSHYQVWLGFLINIAIGAFGFWKLRKRELIGLGIAIWLGLTLAFINLLVPIVGIVADRFAYIFSLGFCIALAALLVRLFKVDRSLETKKVSLPTGFILVFLLLFVAYSARTIIRNPDWHDYLTLYYSDIDHLENSAKAHSLISATLYAQVMRDQQNPENPEKIEEIILHYKHAVDIDSTHLTANSNLGSALVSFKKDYKNGMQYSLRAVQLDSNYLEASFNLAYCYQMLGDNNNALHYYIRTIQINQDFNMAYNYLNKFLFSVNAQQQGIKALEQLAPTLDHPKYTYLLLANLYNSQGNTQMGEYYTSLANSL